MARKRLPAVAGHRDLMDKRDRLALKADKVRADQARIEAETLTAHTALAEAHLASVNDEPGARGSDRRTPGAAARPGRRGGRR